MEGPIDNLTIDAPDWANVGSLLGHLAYDKTDGGKDDFVDMLPLENASDHDRSSPRQGLFTPTLDISKPGLVRSSPAVMQAKSSKSQLVVLLLWLYHLRCVLPLLGGLNHLGILKHQLRLLLMVIIWRSLLF